MLRRRFLRPLLLLLLPPLTTAAEILGNFTLNALTRHCQPDLASCIYFLALDTVYKDDGTNGNNAGGARTSHQTCSFAVHSNSSTTPANAGRTDFQDLPCGPDGGYKVSGGWAGGKGGEGAFVTVVVADVPRGAYAFFGYREDELANGTVAAARTEPAYRVGTLGGGSASAGSDNTGAGGGRGSRREVVSRGDIEQKGGVGGGVERGRQGGGEERGSLRIVGKGEGEEGKGGGRGKTWRVEGLRSTPDTSSNVTDVQFSILDSEAGWLALCSLELPFTGLKSSWYSKRCNGTDFSISWGYNSGGNSAVMTVCYPPNGTVAWFGYDGISNGISLGYPKEEPVYVTGCSG